MKRATIWTRRELHVWPTLEIEVCMSRLTCRSCSTADGASQFLVTFVTSLMKSLDIRSEGAVKLLAEFLDMDTGLRTNAEHFAHGAAMFPFLASQIPY